MTAAVVQSQLATALVQLSHLVQQVFIDVARERDLTPQQIQTLCILSAGPVGMGELARALYLEKSSLTGLVDRLERRGLVTRVRDARDRRACLVTLTDAGGALGCDAHGEVSRRLEALADRLPDADKKQLISTVGLLAAEHEA